MLGQNIDRVTECDYISIQHRLISGRTGDLLKCVLIRSYPPISNEGTHGGESAFVEEQMRFFVDFFNGKCVSRYENVAYTTNLIGMHLQ